MNDYQKSTMSAQIRNCAKTFVHTCNTAHELSNAVSAAFEGKISPAIALSDCEVIFIEYNALETSEEKYNYYFS